MVKTATCPTKEELIRLNHGDLPGDQLESVCDHVEACEKCQLILGQLDEPPNEFGQNLAQVTADDLENARVALEEETLKETATSIWGQFSPVIDAKDREPTLEVPCNLRQYEVIRLIGYGGMGEVYEGRHTNLKRPVALKVIQGIRQDDPVAYEHFLREMETAGQLEHPNLVRAYDAWEHDGCLFLAQELLDGHSLQQLASKAEIKTPAEIIDAMLGTCRALEQLHAKGFVHRDVKPGNIMRLKDGTIKLIDYGLAIAAESGKSAARVGAGTIGYMSPEQAHGQGSIDNRSDIYSAGRVLKYLLSKLPDNADIANEAETLEKLSALADRLTQKDPQDRLQNVYAVVVKLEQLQQPIEQLETPSPDTSSAPSPSPQQVPHVATKADPVKQPKPRAVRSGWLTLIALLMLAIGFGAYQLIFKTDRQTTVLVENHQLGDVIRLTSEDGKVQSVELGDQPKFVVEAGTYSLSLDAPGDRMLNPANITVTGRDQLTVRIEDRPSQLNDDSRVNAANNGAGSTANRLQEQPPKIVGHWNYSNLKGNFVAELTASADGTVIWKDLTNNVTLTKHWSQRDDDSFLISDERGVPGRIGWSIVHFQPLSDFAVCDSWGDGKDAAVLWPAPPAGSDSQDTDAPIVGHWIYALKRANFVAQVDARADGTAYWIDQNGITLTKQWALVGENTYLISDESGVKGNNGWHVVHFPERDGVLECDGWNAGPSSATMRRLKRP